MSCEYYVLTWRQIPDNDFHRATHNCNMRVELAAFFKRLHKLVLIREVPASYRQNLPFRLLGNHTDLEKKQLVV